MGYKIGDRVRVLRDIWEEDQDGLIPAHILAHRGEELIVRKAAHRGWAFDLYVSHEGVEDRSFAVGFAEIEPVPSPDTPTPTEP
jgi:hypothetical protein